MGDIYDDIDEILSADDGLETVAEMSDEDSNFNESELQDIMSEIESLEKEFEAEEETPAAAVAHNPLQDEIERELAASMAGTTESPVVETPKAQVLSFDKPKTAAVRPVATTSTEASPASSNVSFSALGSMALTLDFMIGAETAKLTIDPVSGLTVTLSGVDLVINETEGCHVIMDNGMKFSIPLSTLEKTPKKKTA